jgi:hypothetical protein
MGARCNLLEGFDHLLTHLPTGLQHRQQDCQEDGDNGSRKKTSGSADLRSRTGTNSPGWVSAVVKDDSQTSRTQRGQRWNRQAQRHHNDRD